MDLIAKFIHEQLNIQFSTIKSLQHNTGKSLVFVECQSEDEAVAVTDRQDGCYEIIVENVKYKVIVYLEDGATTVRIHDVSPQTENSFIVKEMERYGSVVWLKEESWLEPSILKGIKNGIRSVRIRLHTAIPSYININGEVTLITYKHQQQTCRHCNKPVHWGRKCIEASYMELQVSGGNISDRLRASGVDYAGALKALSISAHKQTNNDLGNKDLKNNSVPTNYTNLTQLFSKSGNEDKQKPTANLINDSTIGANQTKNETNNNITIGSSKQKRTNVEKNRNENSDCGNTISLADNMYSGLISEDEMEGEVTDVNLSPSRKKQHLSKKLSK